MDFVGKDYDKEEIIPESFEVIANPMKYPGWRYGIRDR